MVSQSSWSDSSSGTEVPARMQDQTSRFSDVTCNEIGPTHGGHIPINLTPGQSEYGVASQTATHFNVVLPVSDKPRAAQINAPCLRRI